MFQNMWFIIAGGWPKTVSTALDWLWTAKRAKNPKNRECYPRTVKELLLQTPTGKSRIIIGDCEQELRAALSKATLIVADSRVVTTDRRGLFTAEPISQKLVQLSGGEDIKSLSTAEKLYKELFERGATRSSLVVAVGGGTVTDLVGFVAATYLRGLSFIAVPTSLLGQVDASVGGKNGVNFHGAKNLIGTTNQPDTCICDAGFLATLSSELIAEGFAEIIKHALLAPSPLICLLQEREKPLQNTGLEEIIYETVKEKKRIVEMDELETGERKKLNLGHTIGHALEGSLRIPHGHAVSIGTVYEAELSRRRGLLSEDEIQSIKSLFLRFSLPVEISFEPAEIKRFILKDKKRLGKTYAMPLITKVGNSELHEIAEEELFTVVDSLAQAS
jgi:3-dehydroquinate synthase